MGMQIEEDLARVNKEGCEMSVRFEKSGHGFRVCRRQKNFWWGPQQRHKWGDLETIWWAGFSVHGYTVAFSFLLYSVTIVSGLLRKRINPSSNLILNTCNKHVHLYWISYIQHRNSAFSQSRLQLQITTNHWKVVIWNFHLFMLQRFGPNVYYHLHRKTIN